MRDIKIKPDMDTPKARNKTFVPKDAVSLQEKKLEQQKTNKEPEGQDGVRYATDQTEHGMRNGVFTAADTSLRMVERFRSDRREKTASEQQKTEQAASPGRANKNTTAVQNTLGTRGSEPTVAQSTKAAPRKRGQQKAIHDAREKKALQRDLAGKKATGDRFSGRSVGEEQKAAMPQKETGSIRKAYAPKSGSAPAKGKLTPKSAMLRKDGIRSPTQYAKAFSQRKAQWQMLQNTVQQGRAAAQKLGGLALQAGKAIGKAVTSAASSIIAAGGGTVVLVLLLTVILVATIVASPFGILFSGESREPGAVPVSAAVAQINYDFNAKLEALQTAASYDAIAVTGQAADWVDVLAVFAVKVAGSDTDAADVTTIDADRIERLKTVFWDMTAIEHEVEVIDHLGTEDEEGWTERNLYITISRKTTVEMQTVYAFSRDQNTALEELLAQRELLLELIEDTYALSGDTAALIQNLPDDLSPEREAVVRTACSLVGKVNYFWGGKSGAIGWDSRWGTVQKVTADGNSTSGTYRPYGLDCSGFVDWVFNNAHSYVIGHGGGAYAQHTYCTNISWAQAQPGDLVFYPEDTHVGIVGGWDEDGNLLIIHCASSANNVVITGASGFTAVGRPHFFEN